MSQKYLMNLLYWSNYSDPIPYPQASRGHFFCCPGLLITVVQHYVPLLITLITVFQVPTLFHNTHSAREEWGQNDLTGA